MGKIDVDYAPGAISVSKRIIRLVDLSTDGTEINLGNAGELWMFCDTPINVRIGDSPADMEKITTLHITGKISSLIAVKPAYAVGRLVLFTGYPSLGANWSREDILNRMRVVMAGDAVNWNALSVAQELTTMTLPGSMGKEAIFLWHIAVERSGGKHVDSLYYEETETGILSKIWQHNVKKDTYDFMDWDCGGTPVRLPVSGRFKVHGASDAAATTFDWDLVFSYL